MSRHLTKRTDTLTAQVEAYFRANPDEWLTMHDGAVKFGCTPAQFAGAVKNLRLFGWEELEYVQVVRVRPS